MLLFLSPVIAELLSSSAPPAEFFTPFGLVVLVGLYGGGSILIRELTIRWGNGWTGRLILALAYAILEEGVMVKTFFGFGDAANNQAYLLDNTMGVGWVWVLGINIYHVVYSILLPILMVELMVGEEERRTAWVSDRVLRRFGWWFGLVVALGTLGFHSPQMVPWWPVLVVGALMVAAGWVLVARRVGRVAQVRRGVPPSPRRYFFEVLGLSLLYWFSFMGADVIDPATPLASSGLVSLWLVLLSLLFLWWARERLAGRELSVAHYVAMVWGLLPFHFFMAFIAELDQNRSDNPTGMWLVGVAFLVFLVWWSRRVRRGPVRPALAGAG